MAGELTVFGYFDNAGVTRTAREIIARRVTFPVTHRVGYLVPKLSPDG